MRKLVILLTLFVGAFLLINVVYAQGKPEKQVLREKHSPVCAAPEKDGARCHVRVVVDGNGSPKSSTVPSGYGPTQLRTAYNLSAASGSNRLIAVVDAYNHPNIKSDLDKYNSTFGLPFFPSCSGSITNSSVPCFQKVNQNGLTSSYPSTNAGWALEIALDVEVAHAMCPDCRLLLVEANSASYSNLMTAVDTAVNMGAYVVSNSYGSNEFSGESFYDSHFQSAVNKGTAVTFSSGDSGYGADYPAASPLVTAVGGTSLYINGDYTYNSEAAWSGSGSGCSAYEAKPSWQHDSNCSNRTMADVSAVADPNTGAAVYDSVRYGGRSGWFQVGGTSLSSPLIAAVYALKGDLTAGVSGGSLPYGATANLHDVASGSNGNCGGSYLCTSVGGYDGPTGMGTPNGSGAF